MRTNPVLRNMVEDPRIQTIFHVAGGLGLGLLISPIVPRRCATPAGLALVTMAVLGHWYAVWSDPNSPEQG